MIPSKTRRLAVLSTRGWGRVRVQREHPDQRWLEVSGDASTPCVRDPTHNGNRGWYPVEVRRKVIVSPVVHHTTIVERSSYQAFCMILPSLISPKVQSIFANECSSRPPCLFAASNNFVDKPAMCVRACRAVWVTAYRPRTFPHSCHFWDAGSPC